MVVKKSKSASRRIPNARPESKTPGTRKRRDAITPNVDCVLAELKRLSSKKYKDGMSRFGIPSDKAFGVPVGEIQKLGRNLGRNHTLALELWKTDAYEARLLCAFIDEPDRVTPAQMDAWAKDFDNWALCDTLCFHLFDKSRYARRKIAKWATRKDEFVKRSAFALMAAIGVHDKLMEESFFFECLPLIERAASDERNFVKKGVSWALRVVGRRSRALHKASVGLAKRLSASEDRAERWVGKDAYRELTSAKVKAAVGKKGR
jgi:3-methyladenine DNA glycosylase AlkD